MEIWIFCVLALISLTPSSHSGVLDIGNVDGLGLYGPDDKVLELSSNNLQELIHNRNYATLLEFYNSFCGHCRRFAPKYKQLAEDAWPWRNLVKVTAIDCAADENNDICRDYEIMAYPTLRYFPPSYEKTKENIGIAIKSQELDVIKAAIVRHLMNDTKSMDSWPDFESLTETSTHSLFAGAPEAVEYVIIILEPENSTLVGEMILQFSKIQAIRIRRVTAPKVAKVVGLEKFGDVAIVDRNSNREIFTAASTNREAFIAEIEKILKSRNIEKVDSSDEVKEDAVHKTGTEEFNTAVVLEEVKKNWPTIYLADLQNAIAYSIFHEIPKFAEINGERLLALQRYINVVKRYNALGENGQKFLGDISEYIMMHNQEIQGEDLEKKLKELDAKYSPIFTSSHWIGCLPSKPGLRGFTCGLWQLFHFMTVTAAEQDKSSDPLEVLQAIHGYVKHFFGCTECSRHFQEMAARRDIWSTSSKDNAVIWLWSAHNEVNKRLAGDETEDPEFPKVQFPSKKHCDECHKVATNNVDEINWDKDKVLGFLKRIYGIQNISLFGINNESILSPTAEKRKHTIGSVFSEMDMRMGILLYLFCIGMMVIAVKLFLYRGYRKKIYAHDILGKV